MCVCVSVGAKVLCSRFSTVICLYSLCYQLRSAQECGPTWRIRNLANNYSEIFVELISVWQLRARLQRSKGIKVQQQHRFIYIVAFLIALHHVATFVQLNS